MEIVPAKPTKEASAKDVVKDGSGNKAGDGSQQEQHLLLQEINAYKLSTIIPVGKCT